VDDHGLLWVANAPIYDLDSNNAIENFVENIHIMW
jgi:hypothetical protein